VTDKIPKLARRKQGLIFPQDTHRTATGRDHLKTVNNSKEKKMPISCLSSSVVPNHNPKLYYSQQVTDIAIIQ